MIRRQDRSHITGFRTIIDYESRESVSTSIIKTVKPYERYSYVDQILLQAKVLMSAKKEKKKKRTVCFPM